MCENQHLLVVYVLEVGHRRVDTILEFTSPTQTARYLGHVFVQWKSAGFLFDSHVVIIDLLGHVQLFVHERDNLWVVAVEVLLDQRSFQERAKDVQKLEGGLEATAVFKPLTYDGRQAPVQVGYG